jgi:hypothetical protein
MDLLESIAAYSMVGGVAIIFGYLWYVAGQKGQSYSPK